MSPVLDHRLQPMSFSDSRRSACRGLLTGLALTAGGTALPLSSALAQFRVEISGVGATQIPVAIGQGRDGTRQQRIGALAAPVGQRGAAGLVEAVGAGVEHLEQAAALQVGLNNQRHFLRQRFIALEGCNRDGQLR